MIPADWVPGPKQGQWTYDDYAAIPDDGQRYEVINGVLYMCPAPNMRHQDISVEIVGYLRQFVKLAGLGRVFHPPTDVELAPGDIVQPDAFVVLNEHLDRMTYSRLIGAPDLVVEILSPGTKRYDLREKLDAYTRAHVPEYWIVSPAKRTVELLVLEHGEYRSLGTFQGSAMLPSCVVPDFPVAVERFFAFV